MSLSQAKTKSLISVFLYIVTLVVVTGGLFYFVNKVSGGFSLKGRSGLSVGSLYGDAQVYLDGAPLGNTPFESEEISQGEHTVTIKNETRQYETVIDFVSGTQVAINRDLGVSDIFSSGQVFWMAKGGSDVIEIISDPEGAAVYIDNTEVGKTPYMAGSLSEGEYDLRVEFPGYESQIARINIKKGYKLNVILDLFPLPVPGAIRAFEGSAGLYNVTSDNPLVVADTLAWMETILYWNQTRGINLADVGLNKDPVFDYFLDYKGDLYTTDGILISSQEDYLLLEGATKGAYLGNAEDGEGLTQEARETYEALVGGLLSGNTATIKPTGFGWLRVRSTPGLTGAEVGRATVGEEYPVLEEKDNWVKVKVSDSVIGWVSGDYVALSE